MAHMNDWECPVCGNDSFDIEYTVTDFGLSIDVYCDDEQCEFQADADVMIRQFEYEEDDYENLDEDDEEESE